MKVLVGIFNGNRNFSFPFRFRKAKKWPEFAKPKVQDLSINTLDIKFYTKNQIPLLIMERIDKIIFCQYLFKGRFHFILFPFKVIQNFRR